MSDVPGSNPPSAPPASAPSGWHPDPLGRYEHRWFNGAEWTDQVSTDGRPSVDPLGTSPSPAGAPTFQPTFQYDEPTGKNGIAVAALVCGIIGVLIAWIPFIVIGGIILATLGVVFGMVGLRRSRDVGRGRGPAIAGIVTGGIGLALAILGIVLTVFFWRALSDFLEPGPHEVTVAECTVSSGLATASGTFTNGGREIRSFSLFVEIDGDRSVVTIDDVPAESTVDWRAGVNVDAADGPCQPRLIVHGPFPFDIELDPVE